MNKFKKAQKDVPYMVNWEDAKTVEDLVFKTLTELNLLKENQSPYKNMNRTKKQKVQNKLENFIRKYAEQEYYLKNI